MSLVMTRLNRETGELRYYCEDPTLPFPTQTWREFYYEHDINFRPRRPREDLDWALPEEFNYRRRPRPLDNTMQAEICLDLYLKKRTERGYGTADEQYVYQIRED